MESFEKVLLESLGLKEDKQLNENTYHEPLYIKVFITNLMAYNDGKLQGDWVDLPVDDSTINDVFVRNGISSDSDWFISDVDTNVPGINPSDIGEYSSIDELNSLGEAIEDIDDPDEFEGAVEILGDIEKAVQAVNNDDVVFMPHVKNYDDLGRYLIEMQKDTMSLSNLYYYIDYEALGKDISNEFDSELDAAEYYCGNEDASYTEIGEEYIDEISSVEEILPYIDYESYGEHYDLDVSGVFTSNGYCEVL